LIRDLSSFIGRFMLLLTGLCVLFVVI
jgi:hypothetical protein